jgi:membrane protein
VITRRIEEHVDRLARLSSYAAELAFFMALALVPFVLIAITLAGRWLPLDLTPPLQQVFERVLPPQTHIDPAEVLAWARSSAGAGWLTASFGLAVITVLRFMFALVAALSFITGEEDQGGSPLWRRVSGALLLTAVWMVVLLFTAILLFIAPSIEQALLDLPEYSDLSLSAFAALRALTVAAILFASIYATYRVGPRLPIPAWRAAVAGGLAATAWLVIGQLLSRLVPSLWNASQLYGTLGSIVLFLVWAYSYAWSLLVAGLLVLRPRRG